MMELPKFNFFAKKEKENEKNKGQSFFVVLFSVFVALVLWFYVQDAEAPDYKKTFTGVEAEMQSLSPSFSVISGGENSVDITLVGKRSDLNKIKSSDLEAYLDLSSVQKPGTYQPEYTVLLPEGTELLECYPQKATVFVDQTVSVFVPVVVEMGEYTVSADTGIEAVSALEEISIKGPKTVLDQIDHAKIKTGKLGQVAASFDRNLDYKLYDKSGKEIDSRHIVLPEESILVHFGVYKTKSVPLTVQCKNGWWKPENMKVTVSPANILVKGEPDVVDRLESIPAVILDETTLDSTRYNVTLAPSQLPLPEGIRLGETIGDIKVNLALTDNGSKTIQMKLDSGHVAVTPPEGFSYSFVTSSLTFKIRGSYETIHKATDDDFYLNIDLSGITEAGEAEIPVQIVQTSATEGKFYPVGSVSVKVMIEK
jgi:YbbR domain-containing protein